MHSLTFSIAGVHVTLVSTQGIRPLRLPAEYSPFECSTPEGMRPDVALDVTALDRESAPLLAGGWSWQNESWRMGNTAAGRLLIEIHDAVSRDWRTAAHLLPDFASGTLYEREASLPASGRMPFHHPHDRAIILGRLAFMSGGMVHSSCVAAGGKALLFVGRSGAGKTTVARLWHAEGATLLNDERNIVRAARRGPLAGSSPWHGEENRVSPLTAPLAAVFYLKKAASNSVRDVPCAESVSRLFTATFVPVFLKDAARMILDAWANVLEAVPSYELSFTPDRRAISACRSAVAVG